ncbi:LCP family protein [Planotetraspora phitsanulokensis]|uniref:LytR family transcriptional regulator n=1 Tax=Planotetraspora phitsanulokensis TaxID=575192 RepID=A0A8J3XGG7_9ACTN|nr:LCP family protein [Planotetraspora phitsanulokensis]GII40807.1 LytR family transcriptional regulator [Planotetraspora phitsanulokensis]
MPGDDDEIGDSGVHVGGDAYGGIRIATRRARRSRTNLRSLLISGSLSSVVLLGSGVMWLVPNYAASQIQSVDAGTTDVPAKGAMNILLVGVDKRDDLSRRQQIQLHLGREAGERSDTMMVVHLSEDHKKVTVVSLPRDSWTDIPGNGTHKINAAYQFGGAKLAVKTVEQATGLRINHYVEVNVLGFIDVVESLGGVTVCTPIAIDDPKTRLALQPGTYNLNGVDALAYARTRATARADLDRIDRQQQVISALLGKALSGDTLTNPVKLTGLVSSTLKTLTVDKALSEDLLGLANQLKDVSTDDVSFATVPLSDVNYKAPTGESAVLWDKPAARELFRRIATDELQAGPVKRRSPAPSASASAPASAGATPSASPTALTIPPGRIAVRVLNGTLITGLGAKTRSSLLAAGFMVPSSPGDVPERNFTNTVIRYPAGREDSARTVAAAFPGAELRERDDLKSIEVVLGQKNNTVKRVKVATGGTDPKPAATPSARTATQNICKNQAAN